MKEADILTNVADAELIDCVDSTVLAAAVSIGDSDNENAAMSESSSRSLELAAVSQELNLNSGLLKQVSKLTQALAESQNLLQRQKEQFKSRELLFIQQAQELVEAQEQIERLEQELEICHQTSQRQQMLSETLTAQLQISQEAVAHLEREFAFNQERYNEQSYQLVQTQNACRELRDRLDRQNPDLQFKSLLSIYPLSSDGSPTIVENGIRAVLPLEANSEQVTVNSTKQVLPAETEQFDEQAPSTQMPQSEPPQIEIDSTTNNVNWPSPVVYPSRPPKGRKSLAAVELPAFLLSNA